MLKKKNKVKLFGVILCNILLCMSYVGISWYAIPERVNAVTWFPTENEERTLADITYMQEVNINICKNTVAKNLTQEFTLIDIRDKNKYTVKAVTGDLCVMTQNLTLDLTKAGIATAAESDNLSSNYPATALPNRFDTESTNAWQDTNTLDEFSKAPKKIYSGSGSYQSSYGYYYSWCAATAKTCSSASSDGADAPGSICPKGWTLPKGGTGTTNDFAKLGGITSSVSKDTNHWSIAKNPYFASGTLTVNGLTWPAVGGVRSSGLYNAGSNGYYWSRTASSSADAYTLNFRSGNFFPAYTNYRYVGFSVRCVANEKIIPDTPTHTDSTSGSISVKVANTLSIDAVSGMEKEVDGTDVAKGTITATIAANTNYKVLLSAEKTSLTSANAANTAEIPTSTNVAAGTNAWGIRNSDNSTYSAITNQEKEYYHATTPSTNPAIPGTVHTFNISISVSPSLPADTYSTEVTITAAAA